MTDRADYINALKLRLDEYKESIGLERNKVRLILEKVGRMEEQALYIQKLLEAENVKLVGNGEELKLDISITDVAHEVMGNLEQKKPIHYRELADLIQKQGKNIPGKDPAANLIAHLGRDNRFVRTGRGLYALVEWGGNFPRKKLARKTKRRRKG